MFIAQAYGIHLTLGQEVTMLLVLMVTSKGMAGVPRASLVVIAAIMPMFHIPEAGLLLILAVDHFLDMGRSATNVVGQCGRRERRCAMGRRRSTREEPADIEPPHAPSHVKRAGPVEDHFYQPKGRSIAGGGLVKNFGPVSVMCQQSSSRTPNLPGM